MSRRNLTPVSYVVLGLIARDGPSTPYDLKAAVSRGIAGFWPFPHSQIYSETDYLTGLGLLAEQRERSGRRRRTFRVTDAGRRALEAWLQEPTADVAQIRSYAFLKLYFGYFARPEDVLALATAQIAAFEGQIEQIRQMIDRLRVRADRKWQLALGELYADLTRAVCEAWKRVAARASQDARAPAVAPERAGRARSSAVPRKPPRRKAG
jgi:DNA-binding PadR family transcriptional regulator